MLTDTYAPNQQTNHDSMHHITTSGQTGRSIPFRASLIAIAAFSTLSGVTWAQDAPSLGEVTVISTTPLPGLGLPKNQTAANVQSATSDTMDRSGALDLSDFLNRQFGSVHVNETSGNPFAADLNYRGYTASPLLGTPQGLSIYMDGVRLNQPFGDVVSWDLIPRGAIADVTLIPGSNPLYGLNTLGGAISLHSKDGMTHPGTSLELLFGSNRRRSAELQHGGSNDKGQHWFTTATLFRESGWRDDSPTRVGQFFGKVGSRDKAGDVSLSLSYADNTLYGNGLQDQRLLNSNYSSVYTKPDVTDNRSISLNLAGSRDIAKDTTFSGNAYYRRLRTSTFNGDVNEDALDQSLYLNAADRNYLRNLPGNPYNLSATYTENAANTPFPFLRCIAQALQNDEPGEKCTGLLNRTATKQNNYGFSGQVSTLGTLSGNRNQFVIGGGYDRSRVHFLQTAQLGYINSDRSVTGINAFADGVTGGDVDGEPLDSRVDLSGRVQTVSAFVSNTTSFGNAWHLSLAGRYNRTQLRNRDAITPGGSIDSLDGDHRFNRFNPAVGLAFTPSRDFSAYFGYNESSRAPTTIELGCANPENECKLPNALAGDPPLNQVVAKTLEAGVRGKLNANVSWNAGVFRAENYDDILFVAGSTPGFGYFKNFGKTRREGVELGMNARGKGVNFGVNYTYLLATFQSPDSFSANANSSNSEALAGNPGMEGSINVRPGDRIPLIPRHLLKVSADWQATPSWLIGLNLVAVSSSLARGNENGQHQPDGTYYIGSGKAPGYGVLNFNTSYRHTPQLEFFAQINNLLDRQYASGAQLGATAISASGAFQARPLGGSGATGFPLEGSTFYSPGAPRAAWIGLRYYFDTPRK
ncbi:MAG TPA: TonB-dependent receptor [Burkholderiaceae bacterium]